MCNFNYKVRQDSGHMGIFEVNTRVGADLACDVPRERAKAFFEKLDKLETSFPHVLPAAAPAPADRAGSAGSSRSGGRA